MIKLIACDMDGTLLDSQKRLPPELPEVIAQLREKGVIFCVASGRQYASLRRDFEAYADDLLFLCENGALVMQRDKRVLIDPVDASFITRIVTATRALSGVFDSQISGGKRYELIKDGLMLSALPEIILYQGGSVCSA